MIVGDGGRRLVKKKTSYNKLHFQKTQKKEKKTMMRKRKRNKEKREEKNKQEAEAWHG